jgi:hypothetical protein
MPNGRIEVRESPDGSIRVIGVHETEEIRSWGGVSLPGSRTEQVLG